MFPAAEQRSPPSNLLELWALRHEHAQDSPACSNLHVASLAALDPGWLLYSSFNNDAGNAYIPPPQSVGVSAERANSGHVEMGVIFASHNCMKC